MNTPKAIIITGYGINCDEETNFAFIKAGSLSRILHINDLMAHKELLKETQILVIPGGFSYGDDMGSGKGMANKIKNNLFSEILEFINQGKLILGICNGFQVLVSLGLLPGLNGNYGQSKTALIHNNSARFECRWVKVKVVSKKCIFTKGIDEMDIPIAHGEGNFYASNQVLKELNKNDQIVLRYITDSGQPARGKFPANPNGSLEDIAGICDSTGRVMGLMPHPERSIFMCSHPDFQMKKEIALRSKKKISNASSILDIYPPAMKIFENAVNYFNK